MPDAFGVADPNFAAARYDANGALDAGFDIDGLANANVAGRADIGYASVLQPDGKIVIAGRVAASGGADPDVGMVRFNSDGTLDTSFGVAGVVRDATAYSDEAADVVLQSDGRLIARYTSQGQVDASFGCNGRRVIDFFGGVDVPAAIAVQPDDRIVVAGSARNGTTDVLGLARVMP